MNHTVTTDAQGVTVITLGDAGARIPAPGTKGERYTVEPIRTAMQTGKPIAIDRAQHDIRDMKTFGAK